MEPVAELIIGTALSYLTNFLYDASKRPFNRMVASTPEHGFGSISEFYERCDDLAPGTSVKLRGTFSNFIPLIPGRASLKRDLHLEFRRNVDRIRQLFDKRRFELQQTSFNYLLSLSAGQMIMRPTLVDTIYVPCGLYESIVRNSILLLVHHKAHARIQKVLGKRSPNKDFAEARITGRVDRMTNTFARHIQETLFQIKGVRKMMDLSKLKALNETTVIRIEDEPRSFRYTGPPRFLDGDIWAVLEKDGSEQLITRFLNLADRGEMDQQYASILAEHREYYGDWNISGMFDHSLADGRG